MGKIHIKTVHGKKYRYERVSTKRKNGKVVTEDKYLGPVIPAKRGRKSKKAGVPEAVREEIRVKYSVGNSVASIVAHLKDKGYAIGERALRNWLKEPEKRSDVAGIREFIAADGGTAEARKRGWATRRRRAADKQTRKADEQTRKADEQEEIANLLGEQVRQEAAETAKWRREAGEWQQRFRTIKK